MTFLELINAVLREINEVEITTVSSTRGIQTSVKDFINKAQRDIINSEVEWPFTVCLLYTSPSPRDREKSRMPSSA